MTTSLKAETCSWF